MGGCRDDVVDAEKFVSYVLDFGSEDRRLFRLNDLVDDALQSRLDKRLHVQRPTKRLPHRILLHPRLPFLLSQMVLDEILYALSQILSGSGNDIGPTSVLEYHAAGLVKHK